MTMRSSVSLTDEQYAFVRTLVDTGRYSSVSAVLRQGLDLLRERLEGEELEHAALRELLARRREGEFVPANRDGSPVVPRNRSEAPIAWTTVLSSP